MFRLQSQHVEVMIEFMENHPDFAKGRLSVSNSRETFKNLWASLTNKLNSLGFGVKTTEKWQKTWSDYKGNLKKKAAEIRNAQLATGGGPPPAKLLTDLEQRILAILGSTFFAGVVVEERGLNVSTSIVQTDVICGPSTSFQEDEHVPLTPPSKNVILTTPPVCNTTANISSISGSKKRSLDSDNVGFPDDHDYLYYARNKAPKKRKNTHNNLNSAYQETIVALKSIESTVSVGLENINRTLNEGLGEIREALKYSSR